MESVCQKGILRYSEPLTKFSLPRRGLSANGDLAHPLGAIFSWPASATHLSSLNFLNSIATFLRTPLAKFSATRPSDRAEKFSAVIAGFGKINIMRIETRTALFNG